MKRFYFISIIASLFLPLVNSAQGVWTQKADYPGGNLYDFVGYALNNNGYIGTGRHSWYNSYLSDWQEFNPVLNTWTQKSSLPVSISGGAAFTAGNKGYVASGANDRTYIYDTYEYDVLADSWAANASALMPRQRATGVGAGDFGYIVGGYNGRGDPMNDCWEYNQPLNTWSQRASLPQSAARYNASGFSVNGKVYIFGGTAGTTMLNDLWEFDALTDTWTQKNSLPGIGRTQSISFVINNEAYVIGGFNYLGYLNECWKYNVASDQWIRLPDFPGTKSPAGGVGFTINGVGYIVCGNGTSECWEFTPDINILKSGSLLTANTALEGKTASSLNLFPNPAKDKVYISGGIISQSVTIYNVSGEVVQQNSTLGDTGNSIDISRFRPGVYFMTVKTGEGTLQKGKFIKTDQ